MAGSESRPGDIFDVDRIRRLVELMKEHDLREIDLKQEDQQIRLCRNLDEPQPRLMAPMAAIPQAPLAPPAAPAPATAPAVADEKSIVTIKSPMVGTFYCRPNPKAEAFVKVGQRVDSETIVCIVEAMKVFNEIPAEVTGTIVAVLVDDGEAVDFGKALFKVDTSK
jgi:acetyl-CoA carboxylase biotin carboxyl carrier protein